MYHHYVPLNLQSRWMTDTYKGRSVIYIDKFTGTYFAEHPSRMLGENDLYSARPINGAKRPFEQHFFGDIDSRFSLAVDAIEHPNWDGRVSAPDRLAIIRFIDSMNFRTPRALRKLAVELQDAIYKSVFDYTGIDVEDIKHFYPECYAKFLKNDKEYILQNATLVALVVRANNAKSQVEMLDWPFSIIRAESAKFINSDEGQDRYRFPGTDTFTFLVPLSPNHLYITSPVDKNVRLAQIGADNIAYALNESIYRSAYRYVICPDDLKFVHSRGVIYRRDSFRERCLKMGIYEPGKALFSKQKSFTFRSYAGSQGPFGASRKA